ncbi:HEAT repeat domain-containing protein, partial [bacterium]|nr:HEAT repeat domain-containing protein [bacterium]
MGLLAGSLLDLRRGERRMALLMGANYFLLLLFYYLLKPARDSLFLVDQAPDRLPLVYILTALIAAPVTAAYARAGARRRLDRLVLLTTGFLAANLVLLRLALPLGSSWLYYVFYSWVGVAGGLTTSQFWLQANGVFDASQAKRIFPLLTVGGIAGAFCGGEITSFLLENLGLDTTDLLAVSAGVLAVSGGLSALVWRGRARGREVIPESGPEEGATGSDLRGVVLSILRSRHLLLTVGIISLTVMTASFVDFQFKTVSWQAYRDGTELTAFLGRFYGRMSLLSLLFQLLLAPRLIRWFGVGNTVLVLPAVMLVGAVAMVAVPGLAAARVLRGGDMVLKYSLDRTSRELLFLPIPLALKKRTKVFIDMFVDRWARGLAGGLLLLLGSVLGLGLRHVAAVTVVLLLVWLLLALMMRRAYVDSFRAAISRREIDLSDLRVRLDDAKTLEVLLGALAGGDRRETIYALDMLVGVSSPAVAYAVRPLLGHEAADVRRRAVAVLAEAPRPEDAEPVAPLLDDPDLDTRVAAVALLARLRDPAARPDLLTGLLRGPGRGRNAALAWLGRTDADEDLRGLVDRAVVDGVLACGEGEGCEGRRVLAGLPWAPAGLGDELWDALLDDADPGVVDAA